MKFWPKKDENFFLKQWIPFFYVVYLSYIRFHVFVIIASKTVVVCTKYAASADEENQLLSYIYTCICFFLHQYIGHIKTYTFQHSS